MSDTAFEGSIPAIYERHLGPLFFFPYADDLAARARALRPGRILETAAGTGIVTDALARALPTANIHATDLNEAMLRYAREHHPFPNVTWSIADAQQLPFTDATYDLAVTQFGAMFFPDRTGAFREVRRVLQPGGTYLCSVWDSLATNDISRVASDTLAALFPAKPPGFLARAPFGHFNISAIEQQFRDAGFAHVTIDTVDKCNEALMARDAAYGICEGSPLRFEIEESGPDALDRAVSAVTDALKTRYGGEHIVGSMRAFVFTAW